MFFSCLSRKWLVSFIYVLVQTVFVNPKILFYDYNCSHNNFEHWAALHLGLLVCYDAMMFVVIVTLWDDNWCSYRCEIFQIGSSSRIMALNLRGGSTLQWVMRRGLLYL